MSSSLLPIEQVLTILAETPQRIAALTTGVASAQLRTAPNQAEWSANDVLAHLRSCADMWGDCIAVILAEDRPTIRAVNPKSWIKQTDYLQLQFQPSLQAFARQRADLLTVLQSLLPEDWSRGATITGGGKPRERDVYSFAQRLARHERPHIKQIERIANTLHL